MSMRDKFEFREPLGIEPDGTYITAGQMQFYLNRPKGTKNFEEGSPNFFEYYNICRMYNVISDLMDEEPDSAMIFWDPEKNRMSMSFPATGVVAKALSVIDPHVGEDDDHNSDSEDYPNDYGIKEDYLDDEDLGGDAPWEA